MGAEHIDEGGGHGLPFDCCERLQPGMLPLSPLFLFFIYLHWIFDNSVTETQCQRNGRQ